MGNSVISSIDIENKYLPDDMVLVNENKTDEKSRRKQSILFNLKDKDGKINEMTLGIKSFNHTGLIKEKVELYMNGTRIWFFKKIGQWAKDDKSQIFIVFGSGGTGKSVMSAKIVQLGIKNNGVIAYHFCRHDNPEGTIYIFIFTKIKFLILTLNYISYR